MINYTKDYWADVEKVLSVIQNKELLYNKSIFITGATGMICSAVAEILFCLNKLEKAGIQIYLGGRSKEKVCKRFYPFSEGKDYFFVPFESFSGEVGDVCPNYIIHGASPADPVSFDLMPVETMLANIIGLKSLLDLARKTKDKRILYISSSEVYGKKNDSVPFSESDYGYLDILNYRACYPSSKRTAETLCAAYSKEYGVDYVIARPGHIFGPSITESDSRASAQFTRLAARRKSIVLKSAGLQVRSYCYTLDCASAILSILINGRNGEAYNISNPNSIISIRELAELFAKNANVSVYFVPADDKEKKSYNLMDNSALLSQKLMKLGWYGLFMPEIAVKNTMNFYSMS